MPLQSSSSFRQSGLRDDRRRRLLTDELSNPGDWPACRVWPEEGPPQQKSEHYGNAEFLQRQLRLLDLIPRRMIFLVLLFFVAVAILAGLEASYAWMLQRIAQGAARVAALDLAAKGSLGCWFSTLLLLAATVAAFLIYCVRRHRTDDYQGRYRIWLWAAAGLFCVAADQAASLREAFRDLMIALTGTSLSGNGDLWWIILYALALGAIGSRLLVDMHSSPFSVIILMVAAAAHALAVVGHLGWILPNSGRHEVMILAGAEMTGNLLLLTSMTLFARHVILDAEGLLPRRKPKSALAEDEASSGEPESPSSANTAWKTVDPPHDIPQPAYRRAATSRTASPVTAPPPASAPLNHKLTKAERKALKERLLRERIEWQRRGQ